MKSGADYLGFVRREPKLLMFGSVLLRFLFCGPSGAAPDPAGVVPMDAYCLPSNRTCCLLRSGYVIIAFSHRASR